MHLERVLQGRDLQLSVLRVRGRGRLRAEQHVGARVDRQQSTNQFRSLNVDHIRRIHMLSVFMSQVRKTLLGRFVRVAAGAHDRNRSATTSRRDGSVSRYGATAHRTSPDGRQRSTAVVR